MVVDSHFDNAEQFSPPRSSVDVDCFHALVSRRSLAILSIANRLLCFEGNKRVLAQLFTRPMTGMLLSQASQQEELLDAYGAMRNRKWRSFREIIATLKLFTSVHYMLLHIQHAIPSYLLESQTERFARETEEALEFTSSALIAACRNLVNEGHHLGLSIPEHPCAETGFLENLPPGVLPRDIKSRKVVSAAKTVTRIASAFLNQAAEAGLLKICTKTEPKDYPACFPSPVNEIDLRGLEQLAHNLQALYDTHVSNTDVEGCDEDLLRLRGHITVVYHLLETATEFTHHYERHLSTAGRQGRRLLRRNINNRSRPVVKAEDLLRVIMEYSISNADLFLTSGKQLCKTMLKRYAEQGEITVSAPRYRGFHVRPSTLIAKIVIHYGSDVTMEMGGHIYDASTPLELFRANEQINAQKRRWIAEEIGRIQFSDNRREGHDTMSEVRKIITQLAQDNKVVIYKHPLPAASPLLENGDERPDLIISEVARLQSIGTIDIQADINVTFRGDKRVLADVRLLAKNGYGEDNFGNNVALPKKLSYLRR